MTIAIQTQIVVRQSTIEMEGEEIRCGDLREMQLRMTVPLTLWRGASFASSVVCPSFSFPDLDAEPLSMLSVSLALAAVEGHQNTGP